MAQVYKVEMTEKISFYLKADNEDEAQEFVNINTISEVNQMVNDTLDIGCLDYVMVPDEDDCVADIDISEGGANV